jgi:hypothetical protein
MACFALIVIFLSQVSASASDIPNKSLAAPLAQLQPSAAPATVYDCIKASAWAARELSGEYPIGMQSHFNGYEGRIKSGTIYVELSSCTVGSHATSVESEWDHRSEPITLFLRRGAIRFIRFEVARGNAIGTIRDERNRSLVARVQKIPTSVVCYMEPGLPAVFYNFAQPTPNGAHPEMYIIEIIDQRAGPAFVVQPVP